MQLKFGKITEVDAVKGLAKVTFEENDNMVSSWLPMAVPKSLKDKFSIPYDVNEHVYCIMDERCENGVVAGAIYDEGNKPDEGDPNKIRVKFEGNLCVEYDRNSSTLSITGDNHYNIDVSGNANIKCNKSVVESLTDIEIKAATEIKLTAPLVTVSQDMNVTNKVSAENVQASVEVKAGVLEIPLSTHKHTGVQTGAGTSGPPTP